jgi:hypothetical protein
MSKLQEKPSTLKKSLPKMKFINFFGSVPDPDPRVFGPPRSGSISQMYGSGSGSCSGSGSGSGSFYHLANIVGKTLISTVL